MRAAFLAAAALAARAHARAFDGTRYDNVVAYWGQNSWGGLHPNDSTDQQQSLGYYCKNAAVDVFPLAFLTSFFSADGLPSLDLANICSTNNAPTFGNSQLPNCSFMAPDIKACQAAGKLVTLSLGGADGSTTFTSDAQAEAFAQQIWDLFLGGSSDTRPFADAVLDGLDLDIEGGSSTGHVAFVNAIRALADGASKRYYITAAPQCPYPDGNLGTTLNNASFDAVYVQFYNNACALNKFGTPAFNFGQWDVWARTVSPNRAVRVYVGAPGSGDSAGAGFVPPPTLARDAAILRAAFPSFGGAMFWDMSSAWADDRADQTVKNALTAAGGTGFSYPACSAPAFEDGTQYSGGTNVSYNGYIWTAAYDASSAPSIDTSGAWMPVSACGGPPTTTSAPVSSAPAPTSDAPGSTAPANSSTAVHARCVVRPELVLTRRAEGTERARRRRTRARARAMRDALGWLMRGASL